MTFELSYVFVGLNEDVVSYVKVDLSTRIAQVRSRIFELHARELDQLSLSLGDLALYAPSKLSLNPGGDRAERVKSSLHGISSLYGAYRIPTSSASNSWYTHQETIAIPAKRKTNAVLLTSGVVFEQAPLFFAIPLFALPLPSGAPPDGFSWEERSVSNVSAVSAFAEGFDSRDQFLGSARCIVCGEMGALGYCHIIPQPENRTWNELREHGWLPPQAKRNPAHEPRNGLLMCANHRILFDTYHFFIRFIPELGKFIFVHHSGLVTGSLNDFHGKAVALDTSHHYAPFASLFIIHEMRVRGFNPFQKASLDIDPNLPWQQWMLVEGVVDLDSGALNRAEPSSCNDDLGRTSQPRPAQIHFPPSVATNAPPGKLNLELNSETIDEMLAAMREMPTWKACMREGTSWDATAEENIQKYMSSIGTEEL